MSDDSLTRLLALNQELASLSAAGLPIDIGIDASSASIPDTLGRFDSLITKRIELGQTVDQIIADETSFPERYRVAARTWLHSDDPTIALDHVTETALADRELKLGIGQSLVYPLLVVSLTFFAFLLLCNFATPTLQAVYEQLSRTPSQSLRFLMAGKDWMIVWVPITLACIAAICIQVRRWTHSRSSAPGSATYIRSVRRAEQAEHLSKLLQTGLSLDESLALIGSKHDARATRSRSSTPDLLEWATRGDIGGESRQRVLQFVAATYRQKAQRQARLWRWMIPTTLGVLVGGIFVLGYSLSLFLPVIQLLKDVALPGGV